MSTSGNIGKAVFIAVILAIFFGVFFGVFYIEVLLKRRCDSYQKNTEIRTVDCGNFAGEFAKALKQNKLSGLFRTAPMLLFKNKVLLWSGVPKNVKGCESFYSSYQRLQVDTLIGYMADTGYFDKYKRFWNDASQMFAQNATGQVSVVLGNVPAYRSGSTFRVHELPNLIPGNVTQVRAIVVKMPGKDTEQCGTGSLDVLRRDVQRMKIQFSCENNPVDAYCFYNSGSCHVKLNDMCQVVMLWIIAWLAKHF